MLSDPPTPEAVARSGVSPAFFAAAHTLARVDAGHEASFVLARAGRGAGVSTRDARARLVSLVHGVLRARSRLDAGVLKAAGGTLPQGDVLTFARLAALLAERGESAEEPLKMAGRDADLVRAAAREAKHFAVPKDAPPPERLALEQGYPSWLATRLVRVYGEEATAIAVATNLDPPLVVRTNALKTTRDALVAALKAEGYEAVPTRLSPWGLAVTEKEGIFRTRAFQDGWFEVQDEGSQVLALLAGAAPGGLVLDACAGSGGKTLALGASMANKGRLIGLDVSTERLHDLRTRGRRAGLFNYETFVVDDDCRVLGRPDFSGKKVEGGRERLPDPSAVDLLPSTFDSVLVDAPCTGVGAVRRTPEIRWKRQPEDLLRFVEMQRRILAASAERVKKGGRLVYATCSLLPEENEGVVDAFVAARPEFHVVRATDALPVEVPKEGLADDRGFLRLFPHRHGTEGFFAAVLRRSA
ncbi:MAG: RsmB/NOP family class I SAM-dependent RNA methyltransferase [Methanobacteriota archaeon]